MSAATLPGSRQRADRARDAGLAERVFRIRESGIVAVLVIFVAVTTIVRSARPVVRPDHRDLPP